MSHENRFRVQPLRNYKEPAYATESGETTVAQACWLSWLFPQGLVKKAATLLLAAGLAFGVVACNEDGVTFQDDQQEQDDDDDDTTACEEGQAACVDEDTVKVCNDEGKWKRFDCWDYCQESVGPEYIPYADCDENDQDNPCQCEYGTTDGVAEECTPGEVSCADDSTLMTCDNYYWETKDCSTYCTEEFGEGYVPYGACDANQTANPCQCEYGTTDGVAEECTPGEVSCADDNTVMTCDDYYWETQDCNTYCTEQYGEDYYSYGCNAESTANPCQCEYGMIDGEMVECTPGDLSCSDEGDLLTCDNYYWETQDCQQRCQDTYGDNYFATGCNSEYPLNPCQCEYGMLDGEMVECTPGETIFCTDDGHSLATCSEDGTYYEYTLCPEYCLNTYGEYYISAGCNISNVDDPCQCGYGVTDGVVGDVDNEDLDK